MSDSPIASSSSVMSAADHADQSVPGGSSRESCPPPEALRGRWGKCDAPAPCVQGAGACPNDHETANLISAGRPPLRCGDRTTVRPPSGGSGRPQQASIPERYTASGQPSARSGDDPLALVNLWAAASPTDQDQYTAPFTSMGCRCPASGGPERGPPLTAVLLVLLVGDDRVPRVTRGGADPASQEVAVWWCGHPGRHAA